MLGHAVPMSIVVRTEADDAQFYREIGCTDWEEMLNEEAFMQQQKWLR